MSSKAKVVTKVRVKKTTVTSTDSVMDVTGDLILDLLIGAGYPVPRSASVYFAIPGGADWSNTSLDVDAEYPVRVRWQLQETEVSGDG